MSTDVTFCFPPLHSGRSGHMEAVAGFFSFPRQSGQRPSSLNMSLATLVKGFFPGLSGSTLVSWLVHATDLFLALSVGTGPTPVQPPYLRLPFVRRLLPRVGTRTFLSARVLGVFGPIRRRNPLAPWSSLLPALVDGSSRVSSLVYKFFKVLLKIWGGGTVVYSLLGEPVHFPVSPSVETLLWSQAPDKLIWSLLYRGFLTWLRTLGSAPGAFFLWAGRLSSHPLVGAVPGWCPSALVGLPCFPGTPPRFPP